MNNENLKIESEYLCMILEECLSIAESLLKTSDVYLAEKKYNNDDELYKYEINFFCLNAIVENLAEAVDYTNSIDFKSEYKQKVSNTELINVIPFVKEEDIYVHAGENISDIFKINNILKFTHRNKE